MGAAARMSVRVTGEACAIIARRRWVLGAASRDDGRCWRRWSTLVERPLCGEARACASTPRDSWRLLAGRSAAGWTRCATSRPLLVDDCAAHDGRWARCCVALGVVRCALPPRVFVVVAAPPPSGESPAMS
ncbi:hypothetical protein F511_26097 [Dorcoceras hygrometricum]|uniref:Uncharacterized protein n=1 Tax=Dorcoceras hygrometricum TaxID=472368 RepID=A0A2Z7CCJ8_9LAMI|nr:hypothetical protein F511_26097 [Dorcoceras hygrometricum]